MFTTLEAAVLLSERGMTDRKGGPVKVDTVKHMCAAGKFPGAYVERRGPGKGYWLIPTADIDALTPHGAASLCREANHL